MSLFNGMFHNGANCDIYIGKNAGYKLLNDIRQATKCVRIISPYLSPHLVSELINIRKRNIEIELITSDTIKDFDKSEEQIIRRLIIQNRITDYEGLEKLRKLKYLSKVLTIVGIVFLIVLLTLAYFSRNIFLLYGLVPLVLIFVSIHYSEGKAANLSIYKYWYSQLFPFKVYMSPYKSNRSDTFLHSKIYLIDDRIAYMGSLNFTASGTRHNYETRIRTTDSAAVNKIKNEFHTLIHNTQLPERNIQHWGQQLYPEPLN